MVSTLLLSLSHLGRLRQFKTPILVSLLVASSFLLGGSALATTFEVAVGDAQGSAQWDMASKFKPAFEAKTGGQHKVDLFRNGQLGSEEATINSASMGALDFSVLAISNVTRCSTHGGRAHAA